MAAVKQKAKQELIVYPRGDEEIEEMGDYVSYSAALKNRKLGVALCRSNPAANRQLTSQLQVLDRQQHRRRFDLQHKQCEFFVQQLFEKRLNPFLKRPELDNPTHARHVTSREASGSAVRATGKPLLTLQRSVTVSGATSQQPETDTQKTSLTSQKHTKFDPQQRGRTWIMAPKPVQEQYACAMTLKRSETAGVTSDSTDGRGPRTREGLSRICIPVPRSDRTLTALKRSPERLFPKMKQLLQKRDDTNDVTSAEATPRRKPVADVTLPPMVTSVQNQKAQNDRVDALDSEQEGQFGADQVFRMIRQLSSNLPAHLRATAKEQIREMTNADSIDMRNDALKRACVGFMYRERTLGDRRWAKLQMALSPRNLEDGDVTWKRKSGNSWSQFKKDATY